MKSNFTKTIFFTLIFSVIMNESFGQEAVKKSAKKNFELSFGQSILFISNSDQINLRNTSAIVIPTSSILFFIELHTLRKVRIPLFYNLPTGAKQFMINNQLINEEASSSYGAGLQFKLFEIKIDSKSTVEMEIGPLASFGNDKKGSLWFSPILASRIRIMKGENFVMYIGGSYAVGVNALGLFYGTGTIF